MIKFIDEPLDIKDNPRESLAKASKRIKRDHAIPLIGVHSAIAATLVYSMKQSGAIEESVTVQKHCDQIYLVKVT